MEGGLGPGGAANADKGMSLQRVINERRKKRQQKHDVKRNERRERLLKQEAELKKQRDKQALEQADAIKQAQRLL